MAALILITFAAVFFFLPSTLQGMLHRRFEWSYFITLAAARRLEFLEVGKLLQTPRAFIGSRELRRTLKCDSQALICPLKSPEQMT